MPLPLPIPVKSSRNNSDKNENEQQQQLRILIAEAYFAKLLLGQLGLFRVCSTCLHCTVHTNSF